jgi:hypothetical protein
MRRLVVGLLTVGVIYLIFIFAGGFVLRGCAAERVRQRLADALDADVTIGSSSLSIWRGELELEDIEIHRSHGGAADIRIDSIDADLAGWGALVWNRDVRRAEVRGVDMHISARGLVEVARRKREPLRVHELVLDDAVITISPTALLPGLGEVTVRLQHTTSRGVELAHGLSWLSGLRALDAKIDLPAGLGSASAAFAQGALTVAASMVGGGRPLTVPFKMPEVDPDAYEIDQLKAIAKELVRSAGKTLLEKTVRDKVLEQIGDWIH